ncbi:MAG: hypothetical protein ABIS29_18780, partial [Vicinamibacterales bacterium]
MSARARVVVVGLYFCLAAGQAAAQSAISDPGTGSAAPGLAVPQPPATVVRTTEGRVTVRAVRIPEPLRLDGRLDESVYTTVPAISDFIQQEPREGEPATEKTEAWIFFDGRNIYIAARCFDSHPERDIENEMRRDG